MLSLSLTYSRLGNESTYKKARSIHKDLTHFCYREWYKDTTIMNLTLPDQSDRESITRIWYEWRGVELRRRMGYAIWVG